MFPTVLACRALKRTHRWRCCCCCCCCCCFPSYAYSCIKPVGFAGFNTEDFNHDFSGLMCHRHRNFLPSLLWHCSLGDRKGIRPVKSWVLVCCWWPRDWSFARLTAPVVTTTSVILSSNKIQNEDILVLAYPGWLGKWPLNEYHHFHSLSMNYLADHFSALTVMIGWQKDNPVLSKVLYSNCQDCYIYGWRAFGLL